MNELTQHQQTCPSSWHQGEYRDKYPDGCPLCGVLPDQLMINPMNYDDLVGTPQQLADRRNKKKVMLHALLLRTLPQLNKAEADMRRAFNRWDKLRRECESIERKLDKLDREAFKL